MDSKVVRVGDIATINSSQYSPKEKWSHIQYLDTGSVTKGSISDLQQLDPAVDKIPSRARRKVFDKSIVYSMVRPNQEHYAFLDNPPTDMLVSTGFSVIDAKTELVSPGYLYYSLTTAKATEHFQSLAEQCVSTYPTLGVGDLSAYEIVLPSLDIQRAIERILGDLDDKIKLNSQLNDYLSELIEAVFVEWFVGVNSRYPTKKVLMDEIAFVNAGGDKPDVWQKCQTEEFPIPIFSNGIDNEGLYGYTTTAKITKPSITVSARGTIGFTCLRHEPYYPIVRLVSATPRDYVTAEYLYLWVKRAAVIGVGTTQQQLTVPMFKNYEVDVPDATSMEEFTRVTTPLFKMVDANKAENRKLSELRNALLPKLISGEVDISKVVI